MMTSHQHSRGEKNTVGLTYGIRGNRSLAATGDLRARVFAIRLALAAPKWAVWFGRQNLSADSRTHSDMRSFCIRKKPSYARFMVGRSGGAFGLAGFAYASRPTLLRLTTLLGRFVVRFKNLISEAAAMVATPTPVVPKFFTFLLAPRPCRLAALRRVRTVSTVAHTEAEARSLLGGLPLVFVSRCPAGEVAA